MARRSWKRILVLGLGLIFVSHLILTLWTAQTFPDEAGDDYGGTLPPSALYHLLSPFNVSEDILELRKTISKINGDALVFNEDLFGGSAISPETVLFVIQVHNRGTYLRALIESLKEVRGITDALLVFSHDRYSDEINQIVRNVSFTRYMQIFYPYSVQLYPKAFAGKDFKGFILPEEYGQGAQLPQIKLHWVWKLTQVFRDINALANHSGPKIFLEEDHYVLPDIIFILEKIQNVQAKECPHCLIVLGGYPFESTWKTLEWNVLGWNWFYSSGNNMGMVLSHKFWNEFSRCGKQFCKIADYNWDWTLQHLNNKCFRNKLQVLKPRGPRVFHVGDCGAHTKAKIRCTASRQVGAIQKIQTLVRNTKSFFGQDLKLVNELSQVPRRTPEPFGGWADPRDHKVCLHIVRQV